MHIDSGVMGWGGVGLGWVVWGRVRLGGVELGGVNSDFRKFRVTYSFSNGTIR